MWLIYAGIAILFVSLATAFVCLYRAEMRIHDLQKKIEEHDSAIGLLGHQLQIVKDKPVHGVPVYLADWKKPGNPG